MHVLLLLELLKHHVLVQWWFNITKSTFDNVFDVERERSRIIDIQSTNHLGIWLGLNSFWSNSILWAWSLLALALSRLRYLFYSAFLDCFWFLRNALALIKINTNVLTSLSLLDITLALIMNRCLSPVSYLCTSITFSSSSRFHLINDLSMLLFVVVPTHLIYKFLFAERAFEHFNVGRCWAAYHFHSLHVHVIDILSLWFSWWFLLWSTIDWSNSRLNALHLADATGVHIVRALKFTRACSRLYYR